MRQASRHLRPAAVQVRAKASSISIVYDAAAHPYSSADKDEDGKGDVNDQRAAVRYNAWSPTLLRAAFNLQYAFKDPGAFAHNPDHTLQVLYDSIASLDEPAVAGMPRPWS